MSAVGLNCPHCHQGFRIRIEFMEPNPMIIPTPPPTHCGVEGCQCGEKNRQFHEITLNETKNDIKNATRKEEAWRNNRMNLEKTLKKFPQL